MRCWYRTIFNGDKIFKLTSQTTPYTNLQYFQFKIMHRILATNTFYLKLELNMTKDVPFVKRQMKLALWMKSCYTVLKGRCLSILKLKSVFSIRYANWTVLIYDGTDMIHWSRICSHNNHCIRKQSDLLVRHLTMSSPLHIMYRKKYNYLLFIFFIFLSIYFFFEHVLLFYFLVVFKLKYSLLIQTVNTIEYFALHKQKNTTLLLNNR